MAANLSSNERSLADRLFDAQVASCSCLTKTPAHEYHDPMCRYRLFYEAWRALSRQPSVTMNGFQARMVLKFIDGDDECSLEVADLPERTASNGEHMAAGLYVWLSDYPEEGCLLLTEAPTAEGFCAEPKQVETEAPQPLEYNVGEEGWMSCDHCDAEVVEALTCTGCGAKSIARPETPDSRDAARYRALRVSSLARPLQVVDENVQPINDEEIDCAIDAYMERRGAAKSGGNPT